jgi:hypothetical protein
MVCPLGCAQMFAPPTFFCRVDFARQITQIAAFPYIAPAILVIWEGLGRFRFPTSPSPLEAFWAADPPGTGPSPRTEGAIPPSAGGPPGRPSTSPARRLAAAYVSGPGRPPAALGYICWPVLPPPPRCRLCKRPCAAPGGHGHHQRPPPRAELRWAGGANLLLPSTRPTFHLVAAVGIGRCSCSRIVLGPVEVPRKTLIPELMGI